MDLPPLRRVGIRKVVRDSNQLRIGPEGYDAELGLPSDVLPHSAPVATDGRFIRTHAGIVLPLFPSPETPILDTLRP